MRKVISNTSCLIVLSNINRLDILNEIYGTIFITPEVKDEFGEELPGWIKVEEVKDNSKTKLIANILDMGEASTIALALEREDSLVILDDGKARRFAAGINLKITGTLGVIINAKKVGLSINVHKIIADMKQCGFRIPNDIEKILNDE